MLGSNCYLLVSFFFTWVGFFILPEHGCFNLPFATKSCHRFFFTAKCYKSRFNHYTEFNPSVTECKHHYLRVPELHVRRVFSFFRCTNATGTTIATTNTTETDSYLWLWIVPRNVLLQLMEWNDLDQTKCPCRWKVPV